LKKLNLKNSLVRYKQPMALKTTLRVGGTADIYIEAGDPADLALVLSWAGQNGVPVRIIGSGSNVLASDLGVRGIVLRLKGASWRNFRREKNGLILAGAGVGLQGLVAWATKQKITGTEFLAGIPGTVGGAARMNAGAWGREFADIVKWVRVMEMSGKTRLLGKSRLGFAYRSCKGLENRIVLEAALSLQGGKAGIISRKTSEIMRRRKWMGAIRSAGSIFKNPKTGHAGRLIENAGLKGRMIGGAKITDQHANIIATNNRAIASDVLALAGIARNEVKIKLGVNLTTEIECLE
jgi:UDP-N-acetylmuramate dehydrogenase